MKTIFISALLAIAVISPVYAQVNTEEANPGQNGVESSESQSDHLDSEHDGRAGAVGKPGVGGGFFAPGRAGAVGHPEAGGGFHQEPEDAEPAE